MIENGELPIQSISLKLLKNFCNQIKQIPGNIVLAGLGEPLLYENLTESIHIAKSTGQWTTLITNAIELDEDMSKQILASPLDQINLSVNTFNADLYKKLNGVDKFYKVVENVETFLRKKSILESPMKAVVQLLLIDINHEDRPTFIKFFNTLMMKQDRFRFQVFENAGGRIDATKYDSTAKNLENRRPCQQLWRHLSVTASGDVYPCCVAQITPSLVLGNIHDTTIKKMLGGVKLGMLRKMHKHNEYDGIPECKACNLWRKPVNTWFKLGDRWI
jgi:radical SAM protein with 4Fe4S-binding SPASM domain